MKNKGYKGKEISKLINANIILVLLIVTGIVLYLFKPAWFLENGRKYDFAVTSIRQDLAYCFVDHPEYDIVSIGNYNKNLLIKASNKHTGKLAELEMYNVNSYGHPLVWADNNAWFCAKSSLSQVNIIKVFDDSLRFRPESHNIHNPDWKQNLLSAETRIGDHIFEGWYEDRKLAKGFFLKGKAGKTNCLSDYKFSDKDSLFLVLSEEVSKNLRNMQILNYSELEVVTQIADSLSHWLNETVETKDVYRLITNRQRAYWFNNYQENVGAGEIMSGRIIQECDLDHNGKTEFLIVIAGSRFVPNILLCYDYENDEVLWERALYEGIIDFEVNDLDEDGRDEIILGTKSYGNRHGSAWFEYDDAYYSYFSSILILDDHGKTWQIKGKDAHYITGSFPQRTYLSLLPNKKILFGITGIECDEISNLKLLDPQTGLIDTLGFSYFNLVDLLIVDNEINVWHKNNEYLYRTVLDDQLKDIETHSFLLEHDISMINSKSWFYHNGERFWISTPFRIFDDDLELQYSNQNNQGITNLSQKGDRVYFVAKDQADNSYVMELLVKKNNCLNMFYVFLWLLLLASSLVYIVTRAFFKLPLKAMDGSYAVLYNVMGLLYNWRIFGAGKIYSQPMIASFHRKKFEEQMQDITDSFKEVKTRNLGFIKLHFYKMVIGNEMHIIQRIAHDLKNQVLFLNMQLEEELADPVLSTTLSDIGEKATMLSDFSRLNLLKKEPSDLITLIDTVLLKFNNHKRFTDLIWQPQQTEIMLNIDEKLMQLALINILDNCLKYSPEGTKVDIELGIKHGKLTLTFKNSLLENSDSISHGSGIGLITSQKVIMAHGGEFVFSIDKKATTKINLSLNEEECLNE